MFTILADNQPVGEDNRKRRTTRLGLGNLHRLILSRTLRGSSFPERVVHGSSASEAGVHSAAPSSLYVGHAAAKVWIFRLFISRLCTP